MMIPASRRQFRFWLVVCEYQSPRNA
jgi:hypothetical protein